MSRNGKDYIKMAALLPKATVIYLKKQKKMGMMVLHLISMLCVILAGAFAIHLRSSAHADEPSPEAAPSPSVVARITSPTPSPEQPTASVTLTFAGDCTLGMDSKFDYESSLNARYDREGAAYFFENVRNIFAQDDLTVVNFEGTLTDSLDRADKEWAFKGPKEYVSILTEGSVEAVNLANNHSCDYGARSFADTKQALDGAGIAHFGFEDTVMVEVNGVRVGLLGMYSVYEDSGYLEQLRASILSLQEQGAQIIVANFHWGLEMSYAPEASQVELAHAAIDAGAHLVIGHHPHVLQGVEVYNGHYIVYSLGNFCFGGNCDPQDYDCMIFQQTFTVVNGEPQVDDEIQVIPCWVSSDPGWNNYQPTPVQGQEQARIFNKLREISQGLGDRNIFEDYAP